MNLYIIRHAPTEANISGDLVKNYDSYDILPFDVNKWWNTVGIHIPKTDKINIFCSPAKRCVNTAKILFPEYKITENKSLSEFDCSGLAGKKFWEISEEEFNKCSGLNKNQMNIKIGDAIISTMNMFMDPDTITVWVTHGLFGRTAYSFYNNTSDTPYELINSKNIQFRNLDMMHIKTTTGKTEIFRF